MCKTPLTGGLDGPDAQPTFDQEIQEECAAWRAASDEALRDMEDKLELESLRGVVPRLEKERDDWRAAARAFQKRLANEIQAHAEFRARLAVLSDQVETLRGGGARQQ